MQHTIAVNKKKHMFCHPICLVDAGSSWFSFRAQTSTIFMNKSSEDYGDGQIHSTDLYDLHLKPFVRFRHIMTDILPVCQPQCAQFAQHTCKWFKSGKMVGLLVSASVKSNPSRAVRNNPETLSHTVIDQWRSLRCTHCFFVCLSPMKYV